MTTAQPFTIERSYNAPVSKVWKAITDKNDMKQWYFDLSDFKAEPGFKFSFNGKGRKGETYVHLCELKEVVFEKKLSYSWTYEGLPGYTLVTFELFKEGDKTRVKLTHEGIESLAGNGPDFAKESFAEGWTQLIGTLLGNFVEKK